MWFEVLGWIALAFALTYFLGRWTRHYSWVDACWAGTIGFAALAVVILGEAQVPIWAVVLPFIWGLRLMLHLGVRTAVLTEDGRYERMEQAWKDKNPHLRFAGLYLFQWVSVVGISLGFVPALTGQWDGITRLPNVWEVSLLSLAVVFLVLEAWADLDLLRFKRNPANKTKVLNSGLWAWSRHPNYFADLCFWTAWAASVSFLPMGWMTWLSPVVVGFFLLRVSGVPLSERQNMHSKPAGYAEYVQKVPRFWPRIPRG